MKNYVTFYSPGSFCNEQTKKEIESWNVNKAIELSKSITERHGAKPYAFRFSKGKKTSNLYYLGGTVLTLQEVKDRNNPDDRILIQNMTVNNKDKIIETNNSYRWSAYLNDDDIVLQYESEE